MESFCPVALSHQSHLHPILAHTHIELYQVIRYIQRRNFRESQVGNDQRATASSLPAESRYAAQVRFQNPFTGYKINVDLLRNRGVGIVSLVQTSFE